MRTLALLLLLSSFVFGQGQVIPTKAVFEFAEGITYEVPVGQVRFFEIPTANGVADFEIGLLDFNKNVPGVRSHYIAYGKNYGGYGQLSSPDQAVHPRSIKVIYENTGVTTSDRRIFDRNNRDYAHVDVRNLVYGLRDAWMQEPTAIETSPENGGTIIFYLLDNREPPNGYPVYPAKYKTDLDGSPGEDPMSDTEHRWKGGFGKMWDLVVTNQNKRYWIENDPMPKIKSDWYTMVRHSPRADRVEYPERVERILESLETLNINARGVPEDPVGKNTLLWWIFQAENRFRYWGDASNEYLNVGPRSHQVGWKQWMSLRWIDGNYNNGYNWLSILFRRWMDNKSETLWWIISRMARWEAMSGICWSAEVTIDNGTLSYTPDVRMGADWYEKGTRGWEVGSDYWPSNYKQYTEQILLADLILDHALSEVTVNMHSDYILRRAGYENWNGNWGQRIPGWGMMNCMAFYRFTGEARYLQRAHLIAQNVLNIMRSNVQMSLERDERWRNSDLGVPYVFNRQSFGGTQFASWATAKIAIGLCEIAVYGNTSQYNDKIKQMAEFLLEECTFEAENLILLKPIMTPDRIPATYLNGYPGTNMNFVSNSATIDWIIWPVAYAAVATNSQVCKDALPQLVRQQGETADWIFPVSAEYYEVGSCQFQHPGEILVRGIDLTGVTTSHRVRFEDFNTGEAWLGDIEAIAADRMVVSGNIPITGEYKLTICGRLGEQTSDPQFYVRTDRDRAVRRFHVNLSNRPPIDRPFNWSASEHFDSWQKILAIPLTQGTLPLAALRYLEKQSAAAGFGLPQPEFNNGR